MNFHISVVSALIIPPTYEVWVYSFHFSFHHTYIRSSFHHIRGYQGQSFCIKVYKTVYYKDPLMDFIYIWHGGRYRSQVLLSAIPTLGPDLEVKVTEFSNESQNICT